MKRIVFAIVAAALVLAIFACGGGGGGGTTSTPQKDAWYACTTAVDKQFGVSYLDAQRYDASAVSGSGPWYVSVYYAKTGATFDCVVSKMADGNWNVVAKHR